MSNWADSRSIDLGEGWEHTEIDTTVPHPARMYDYLIGGKDNYPADREAAERAAALVPGGTALARANRAFLGRAVRFLLDAGVRQFLDIGTGIPGPGSTFEVVQDSAVDARIVSVDNDPVVLAHSRALLGGRGTSRVTVVRGDLRKPAAILAHPDVRAALDFDQPIGVLLVAVLHFLSDADEPDRVVRELMGAVAPGSYLAVSHITADFDPERAATVEAIYAQTAAPLFMRDRARIAGFLDGLEPQGPGLAQWWAVDGEPPPGTDEIWGYAGVARKG